MFKLPAGVIFSRETNGNTMKFIFVVNTPAQAHQYRPAVQELVDCGHEPLILARDYGCTVDLLDYHDVPYEVYGSTGMATTSLYRNLPKHYYRVCKRVWQYDPDVVFGRTIFAAHAGALARVPIILIADSKETSFDHLIAIPFVDAIITPQSFREDYGSKHYRFHGFKECAYLHPDIWQPTADIRTELGVNPDERYVILRFNCLRAHHDLGESGFTVAQRNQLINVLTDDVTVFISDEAVEGGVAAPSAQAFDLHPALMHDALAGADLLIADTQTMVTEAALLGTPAIRSNSFVGESDMGNFIELEQEGLIRNHTTFDGVLSSAQELLADPLIQDEWEHRTREYMRDKVNLTDLIVDMALSYDRIDEFDRLHTEAAVI